MKHKDITQVVDSFLCHSCGTCFSACNHQSIKFEKTTAGYLFPKINYNTCTNCGLCYDVCPGDHFDESLNNKLSSNPFSGNSLVSFTAKATNTETHLNSQSGGTTTALIQYLFETNTIVAAIVTVLDRNLHSKPKLITSPEELKSSQKSKYLPTNLNTLLRELKKVKGKIAVVGLPCHIHGIYNYLKIDKNLDEKIIKIGLICDKVMLYSSLNYFTNSTNLANIKDFYFKDPTHTDYPGDISYYEKNNLIIKDRKERKKMKDFFTPIRCKLCFDKMNIYSDITLGDPHGIAIEDTKNGENIVIVRSEIGKEIVNKMIENNYITYKEVSYKDVLKGQGISKKMQNTNAAFLAWKNLGYPLPSYADSLSAHLPKVELKEIKKNKKQFVSALKFTQAKSCKAVIKQAKASRSKGLYKIIMQLFQRI